MGFAKARMMELQARGFGEVEGSLCIAHILDPALAQRLSSTVTETACTFCGREEEGPAPFGVTFEALLYVLTETFRYHYADADNALSWDSEYGLIGPHVDTFDVVQDVASAAFDNEVADEVLEAVVEALGQDVSWTPWMSVADPEDLDYGWSSFASITRHTARFVMASSSDSTSPPARLAYFLEKLLFYVETDLGLVTDLPIGTELFRGRLTSEPATIHRDSRDLGPAPEGRASANRMSPAGISLFYGSGDPETAVAEIAGHGVEPFAVIGRFVALRPLRVLDLTRTPVPASPFDVERREMMRMAAFLESFVQRITAAVIPDGRQHVDYAPTQVLTEFLRWVPDPKLDGIVLPSAQTGRPTHVLFLGPGDIGTRGDSTPAPEHGVFIRSSDENPSMELDPDLVTVYRVERRYSALPSIPGRRTAPPRLR